MAKGDYGGGIAGTPQSDTNSLLTGGNQNTVGPSLQSGMSRLMQRMKMLNHPQANPNQQSSIANPSQDIMSQFYGGGQPNRFYGPMRGIPDSSPLAQFYKQGRIQT